MTMPPSPLKIDEVPASQTKGQCPKCGSKDNAIYYPDGHIHCFSPSCGYHSLPHPELAEGGDTDYQRERPAPPKARPQEQMLPPERIKPITTTTRGIKPDTMKRYQYGAAMLSGNRDVHIWPIVGQDGDVICQRVRFTAKKDFMVLHGTSGIQPNEGQLFGRTAWGDANDKRVVITEGELDAMSIAQCASFKYPVVSVNGGAQSAAACIKANFQWLNRFDEIILWLDDDEQGRAATDECVKIFTVGKVKLAKVQGFKDANEALQAGKFAEIEQAVYAAVTWRPRGIVNAKNLLAELLDKHETPFWQWPFPSLQTATGGLLRGKAIYHVAGTGVGKTTGLLETLVHCTLNDKVHTEVPAMVGYMGFETNLPDLLKDILTVVARKRLKLDPMDDKGLTLVHDKLFGTGRWELFDPKNAEWTVEAVLGYCDYLVKVLDRNILVIDPLSAVLAMMNSPNERQDLDHIAMILARKAKELDVAIHVAHHLTRPKEGLGHEEGGRVSLNQVRGSGGISNHADGVIGYERNTQAEDPAAQTVTTMRLLKWRHTGKTGVGCYTQYDIITGQTYEITEQEAKRLLGSDAGHGKKAPKGSEFEGLDADDDAPF